MQTGRTESWMRRAHWLPTTEQCWRWRRRRSSNFEAKLRHQTVNLRFKPRWVLHCSTTSISNLLMEIQVNSEVKKLLVASVGEDIEARVDFLTQDKARLAADVMQYRWILTFHFFFLSLNTICHAMQVNPYFSHFLPIFDNNIFATSATEWPLNGRQEMLWGSSPMCGRASK